MKCTAATLAVGLLFVGVNGVRAQTGSQGVGVSDGEIQSVYTGAVTTPVNQMVTVNGTESLASDDAALTKKAQTFLNKYVSGSKITSEAKLGQALQKQGDAALCAKVLQLINSGYKKISASEVSKVVGYMTDNQFLEKVVQKLKASGETKTAAVVHSRAVQISAGKLLSSCTKNGTLNTAAVAVKLKSAQDAELTAAVLLQADSSGSKTRTKAQAIVNKLSDKSLLSKTKSVLTGYTSTTAVKAVLKLVDARITAIKTAEVREFMEQYIAPSYGYVFFGPAMEVTDALVKKGDPEFAARVLQQVGAGYKGIGKDELWGILSTFFDTAFVQKIEKSLKTMGDTAIIATVHTRVVQMRVSDMIAAYTSNNKLDTASLAAKLQKDNDPEMLGRVLLAADAYHGYVPPGSYASPTYANATAIAGKITSVTLLKKSLQYITGNSADPSVGAVRGIVNARIAALQKK